MFNNITVARAVLLLESVVVACDIELDLAIGGTSARWTKRNPANPVSM
jgi:hypothetical protein